jgi:outer membrane protein
MLALALPSGISAQSIVPGQPLALQQAIEIGLKNQPTVTANTFALRAAEARIGEAQANYYPQVNLSNSYQRFSAPTNTTSVAQLTSSSAGVPAVATSGSGGPSDRYTSLAGVTATIFDFGRTPSQVRIQKYNTESARFNLENVKDDVVFNVKQAYFSLLQARKKVVIGRETVEQFQKHLQQAQGFFEVGLKPKFDVTKAEVDLSNAQLALIQAENNLRLAWVTLNNAMGLPDPPEYSVEDMPFMKYTLPYEQALRQAYAQRSDLLSLTGQKKSSKESITFAKRNYLPTLSGSANYYYAGTGFPLDEGWNFGLNMTWPIFSGFLTTYQVAEAQANYDSTVANETNLKLTILLQVQQGYLTLREAEERMANTELTVRQATENLELATGRYQAGVGNPIEVTDALVAHSNAQTAYVTALYDYKIAAARIERSIGAR